MAPFRRLGIALLLTACLLCHAVGGEQPGTAANAEEGEQSGAHIIIPSAGEVDPLNDINDLAPDGALCPGPPGGGGGGDLVAVSLL